MPKGWVEKNGFFTKKPKGNLSFSTGKIKISLFELNNLFLVTKILAVHLSTASIFIQHFFRFYFVNLSSSKRSV